ncbi:MAG: membrane fusion protein (multidrug efflux system) [Flavobacteriales bacterium]|jgi:membrane fusion protein (multidrug efflux system)
MNWRKILIVLGMFLIVALLLIAFSLGENAGYSKGAANALDDKAEKLEESRPGEFYNVLFPKDAVKLPQAVVQVAKNQNSPIMASGLGQVSSTSMINITAEVQGKITTNVVLKKGTTFKKGQLLFTIDNADVKMAIKARKSNYLMLITNILPDLKLDFNDNFDAWLDFYSAIDVNKALPNLPIVTSFKEKNFIVSRNIFTEYYNILADEVRLRKYAITAPFDGSIMEAYTDNGAIINPGSPAASAIRDGKLELEVPISALEIDQVKLDAIVHMADDNGMVAEGTVARIGNYINPQTQTVPVFIKVEESDVQLYNGMYVSAQIECEGYQNIVKIPRTALVGKTEVYKVEGDRIYKVPLNIVSYTKDSFFAKDVKEGEIIVIEPIINAQDSMKVNVSQQ